MYRFLHGMAVIELSGHAITRYHERVKPALTRATCVVEMEALIRAGTYGTVRPCWSNRKSQDPEPDAWLYLTDDIACPMRLAAGDTWVVTTTLARGGLSPEARQNRNRVNSQRRLRKRAARTNHFDREAA